MYLVVISSTLILSNSFSCFNFWISSDCWVELFTGQSWGGGHALDSLTVMLSLLWLPGRFLLLNDPSPDFEGFCWICSADFFQEWNMYSILIMLVTNYISLHLLKLKLIYLYNYDSCISDDIVIWFTIYVINLYMYTY